LGIAAKFAKFADAPIHVVYSSNQDEQSASGLNGGLTCWRRLKTDHFEGFVPIEF
jgi:hypothetical protein